MDWSKYPLEKLIYFIACIVPGITILLVSCLYTPDLSKWYVSLGFFGYKTKLALLLFVAFVLGYSATTLSRAVIGGVAGAVLGAFPSQFTPYDKHETAPWRDPRWRAVLKNYLGEKAPPDTELITDQLYEIREQSLQLLPDAQRAQALYQLSHERFVSRMNDASWGAWYDQFHELVLQPGDRDWFFHLRWGLNINFEIAGLILLLNAGFIPELRHWWLITPSVLWVLLLVAEEFSATRQSKYKWSSLSRQINFLLKADSAQKDKGATL